MKHNPYWYWPQCDVKGCKNVSCNGGWCWSESGHWLVCHIHSAQYRDEKPQPEMKKKAIKREASRDKITGYLPSSKQKNI